jgi:hypothetical protein
MALKIEETGGPAFKTLNTIGIFSACIEAVFIGLYPMLCWKL